MGLFAALAAGALLVIVVLLAREAGTPVGRRLALLVLVILGVPALAIASGRFLVPLSAITVVLLLLASLLLFRLRRTPTGRTPQE